MNLLLPADIETALASAAEQKGTTPELLALECLRERFLNEHAAHSAADGATLADLWAESIGVFSSADKTADSSTKSDESSRKFLELLLEKRRQGRL